MSKHTPGPWVVISDNHSTWPQRIVTFHHEYDRRTVGGNEQFGATIAEFRYNPDGGLAHRHPEGGSTYCTHHEYQANAHLIARAPEMAEQLERCKKVLRKGATILGEACVDHCYRCPECLCEEEMLALLEELEAENETTK